MKDIRISKVCSKVSKLGGIERVKGTKRRKGRRAHLNEEVLLERLLMLLNHVLRSQLWQQMDSCVYREKNIGSNFVWAREKADVPKVEHSSCCWVENDLEVLKEGKEGRAQVRSALNFRAA